jgi:TorA maturation chaperone TorD
MNTQMPLEPSGLAAQNAEAAIPEEQARRAGIYSVLAALLRDPPGPEVLEFAALLEADAEEHKSDLALSFTMLSLAARHSEAETLHDEYHALFIGLGRGELVPYGSWYQTGFLMEKPLGLLRADLAQLGYERSDQVHEPEDHIAALCEVMAMLIQEDVPVDHQRRFFNSHVGNWADAFFSDLSEARSAIFYKSVARLGGAFMSLEARYLSLLD